MATYDFGQSVRVTGTFTNAAGALANPSTVTLTVKAPDGTSSTPTPTNVSTGVYEAIISGSQAGTYRYRWYGVTGTTTPADEQSFRISRSRVLA